MWPTLAVIVLLGSPCCVDGYEFGQDDMGTLTAVCGEEQVPPKTYPCVS